MTNQNDSSDQAGVSQMAVLTGSAVPAGTHAAAEEAIRLMKDCAIALDTEEGRQIVGRLKAGEIDRKQYFTELGLLADKLNGRAQRSA